MYDARSKLKQKVLSADKVKHPLKFLFSLQVQMCNKLGSMHVFLQYDENYNTSMFNEPVCNFQLCSEINSESPFQNVLPFI